MSLKFVSSKGILSYSYRPWLYIELELKFKLENFHDHDLIEFLVGYVRSP